MHSKTHYLASGMSAHSPVIVIEPFKLLSLDDRISLFCSGFVDDLRAELSQFRQFEIRCLPESFESEAHQNVDYIVTGSFAELAEQVKITVQLLEANTRRLVWSNRVTDTLEAMLDIRANTLKALVVQLQQNLDVDLLINIQRKHSNSLKAYEHWLVGFNELKKGTPRSDEKARQHFESALSVDPNYALAYSGISLSYFNEWSCQIWDKWDSTQQQAQKWAEKALEINPGNHIANLILGRVLLFERSYDKAEVYLRKALRLNPNDPLTLIQTANSFVYLGYLEEAESLFNKTIRLDPSSPEYYEPVGAYVYFEKGEFEKCLELGEKYAALAWVDYPAIIAASYYYLDNESRALEFWQQFVVQFARKIAHREEASSLEALKWMMDINPYKGKSTFEAFWRFIEKDEYLHPAPIPKATENFQSQFELSGGIWHITFQGKTVQLPNSKGLTDLSKLIANPGKEWHCTELADAGISTESIGLTDKKALKEIMHEAQQIEEALEQAHAVSDSSEIERLQNEYDQLIRYASSSIDQKGRIRRQGNIADRARSAVTQRIKTSIQRLEGISPALAEHLRSGVRTGNYCSYRPTVSVNWSVRS